MNRLSSILAVFVLPATAAAQFSHEQDGREPSVPDEGASLSVPSLAAEAPVWKLRSRGGYWFDADIDGVPGSMSRWNAGIELIVSIPRNEHGMAVTLDVATGLTEFDFSAESGLVPGAEAPWDSINSHSIWVGGSWKRDQVTIFGGAILASDGESGTSFDDTLTIGGAVGYSKTLSDDLSLGLGIAVQSRLEDDPLVVPFPVIKWKPAFDPERRWSVGIGGAPGGPSRVAGAAITYAPNDTVSYSLSLRAAGVGADFRLDDDGSVPGGVGRDESVPLVLGVEWTPRPGFRMDVYAGASFFRKIELQDKSGNTVADRDVDPAAVIGASMTITF